MVIYAPTPTSNPLPIPFENPDSQPLEVAHARLPAGQPGRMSVGRMNLHAACSCHAH